jgi:hypothetical protein
MANTIQSGIFRPEMLEPMGIPKNVRVLGWGMSCERPTMIKYVLHPALEVDHPADSTQIRIERYQNFGWSQGRSGTGQDCRCCQIGRVGPCLVRIFPLCEKGGDLGGRRMQPYGFIDMVVLLLCVMLQCICYCITDLWMKHISALNDAISESSRNTCLRH